MRKVLLIILIFLPTCGYQPLYKNMQLKDYNFKKITLQGDVEINKKIINYLSIKENSTIQDFPELILKSIFNTEATSKDSKGVVNSYRSSLNVNLKIVKDAKNIDNKNFSLKFDYNKRENNFDLIQYQNKIKSQLSDRIIEDIFLYLNTK